MGDHAWQHRDRLGASGAVHALVEEQVGHEAAQDLFPRHEDPDRWRHARESQVSIAPRLVRGHQPAVPERTVADQRPRCAKDDRALGSGLYRVRPHRPD
jgi:hypothetical protein